MQTFFFIFLYPFITFIFKRTVQTFIRSHSPRSSGNSSLMLLILSNVLLGVRGRDLDSDSAFQQANALAFWASMLMHPSELYAAPCMQHSFWYGFEHLLWISVLDNLVCTLPLPAISTLLYINSIFSYICPFTQVSPTISRTNAAHFSSLWQALQLD